jgi:hypothetical protein
VTLASEDDDLDDWADKVPVLDEEAVRDKVAVRVIVVIVVFENVDFGDPERDDSREIVGLPLSLALEELDVEKDGDVEMELDDVVETLESIDEDDVGVLVDDCLTEKEWSTLVETEAVELASEETDFEGIGDAEPVKD